MAEVQVNTKPKATAVGQQPPLFKNPILEKLSRTHISLPLIIFTIISSGLVYYGVQEMSMSGVQALVLFIVGFLSFTLLEYTAHRFVYHMDAKTDWQEEVKYKFHGVHHDFPKDKTRLALPPIVSVIIASVLFVVFKSIMGVAVFGFLPGLLMGYTAYLGVHYAVHAFRPPNNMFKVLWVHHGIHHYKQSDRAFGVSSPLWDHIFRTMPRK